MRSGVDGWTCARWQPGARGTEVRSVRLGEVPSLRVAHSGADSTGAAAGRAVLYPHGGYTVSSSRTHRMLPGHLSRAVAASVFLLDYRLAPEYPHPAALMDALAAYRAPHRAGYPPERIVLAGDSAGGGLTVATALALREAGEPLPVAPALLSPWLDLTLGGRRGWPDHQQLAGLQSEYCRRIRRVNLADYHVVAPARHSAGPTR
jgi:epsilon-lactone hydrolase